MPGVRPGGIGASSARSPALRHWSFQCPESGPAVVPISSSLLRLVVPRLPPGRLGFVEIAIFENLIFEISIFENLIFENLIFENPIFENLIFENSIFENPIFENPIFANMHFNFINSQISSSQNVTLERDSFRLGGGLGLGPPSESRFQNRSHVLGGGGGFGQNVPLCHVLRREQFPKREQEKTARAASGQPLSAPSETETA